MRAIVCSNERGFSLAETLVAMVLAALGILAATSLFIQLSRGQRAAQGAAALSDYVSLINSALAHPETTELNNCTNDLQIPFSPGIPPATLSGVPASVHLNGQGSLIANANVPNQIQASDGNIYLLTFSGQRVAQFTAGHILPSTHQPATTPIVLYHGNLVLQAERRGRGIGDILGANLSASIPISLEVDPTTGKIMSCSTRQVDKDLAPPPGSGTSAHSANDCYNLGGIPVQSTQGALTCRFVDYTSAYGTGTLQMSGTCPEGFTTSGKDCIVESPPEQLSVPPCPSGWNATPGSENTICTQTTKKQQGSCPNAIPCPEPTSITPLYNSTMSKNGNTPTFDTTGVQVYQNTGQVQTITPPQPSPSPIPSNATCSVTTTCKFNTQITCPTVPTTSQNTSGSSQSTSGSWTQTSLGTCTYKITTCPIPMQEIFSSPLTCGMPNRGPTPFVSNNPGTTGICPKGWTKVIPPNGAVGGGINCQ